jgi:hypothetical protein
MPGDCRRTGSRAGNGRRGRPPGAGQAPLPIVAATTKHFEEAIRLADTLPHHTEQAETRRWHAWALERFGGPADRMRELREAAAERYDRLGGFNPLRG